MRIQHNIAAMNSYRNYNNNANALSKNLEKLSSGYRINRAGDDAAGLAISEKMRAQISGLDQAQSNVKDGISLVKTAEGALQEVQDMLNRMVTLATQSANGTYQDDVDRDNLQAEVEALKSEIDRIARSSNFNGQKLLDGTLDDVTTTNTSTIVGTTDAIDETVFTTTDGVEPNAATKATATLTIGATMTGKALGNTMINGVKISDLFTGVDFTDDTTDLKDTNVTLTAKTAGTIDNTTWTALTGLSNTTVVTASNGTAEGVGSNAGYAKYDLTFDFTKLADGQTFQIGEEVFEISTDGVLNDANANLIDLKGLDLTAAGTANTEGQWAAAKAIQTAISNEFSTSFNIDAVPAAAPAGNKYTINMVAQNNDGTGNLGAVRVSENSANTGAIVGNYDAGEAQGVGTAGKFATVTYSNVDLSKLAAGDSIKIGNTTLNIVADADEDLLNGKIGVTKAKTPADLAAAFESNGYNSGKLDITANSIKITGTDVTETGSAFQNGAGKMVFEPATAAITGSTTVTTTTTPGGLQLQIGDTSDNYNQLTVKIANMKTNFLGTDADDDGVVDTGKSIAEVDISTLGGAVDAIDVIKNAINMVSSTRGNLGAIQNRLEHTQNNLSVMTENIQDAESTIRDTDVADEMTTYTKNNILLQSAQAMLAQANQMPQGVLQLLQ